MHFVSAKRFTAAVALAFIVAGCTGTFDSDGAPGSGGQGAGGLPPGAGGLPPGAGAGGSEGGAPVVSGISLSGKPIFSRFVRLTHEQWENSVRDVLQLGTNPGLSSSFTGDPPDGEFSNNERALFVTPDLRNDYLRAAETLAERVARDAQALTRVAGGMDAGAFIRNFGRRVYRRPLTTAEEQSYQKLFDSGAMILASGNAFADGAELVIAAMLQSPHFLYRTELGPADAPLTGFEKASKLAFLLRNTTPDDALLDAAQAGALDSSEGVAAQAQKLLAEAATKTTLGRYHSELFGIDRYESIDKDPMLFPQHSEALNAELAQADLRFFDHVFAQSLGLRDLLLSTVGFVTPASAPLYGVPAPTTDFAQTDLGAARPGLFTRLGFLAYNASLREPDPIHRGVDINHKILCANLVAPPGDIPQLPASMPGQTNRERVNAHTGPGTCGASCHGGIINPVGFAFENFDAIGRLRSMDNQKPVDTSGAYAFADGLKSFTGAPELLELMANHPQVHACYAKHLAEFALARDLAAPDEGLVTELREVSMTPNSSVQQLILSIIRSTAFTQRARGTL